MIRQPEVSSAIGGSISNSAWAGLGHVMLLVFFPSSSTIQPSESNTQVKAGSEILEAKMTQDAYIQITHGTNAIQSLTLDYSTVYCSSPLLTVYLNGTFVLIRATTGLAEIPTVSGTGSGTTTWECFLDGVSVGSTKPFLSTGNNRFTAH